MSISKKTIKESKIYTSRINKLLKKANELNEEFRYFNMELLIVKIGSHTSDKL